MGKGIVRYSDMKKKCVRKEKEGGRENEREGETHLTSNATNCCRVVDDFVNDVKDFETSGDEAGEGGQWQQKEEESQGDERAGRRTLLSFGQGLTGYPQSLQ